MQATEEEADNITIHLRTRISEATVVTTINYFIKFGMPYFMKK